jgi:hypothetical protein
MVVGQYRVHVRQLGHEYLAALGLDAKEIAGTSPAQYSSYELARFWLNALLFNEVLSLFLYIYQLV